MKTIKVITSFLTGISAITVFAKKTEQPNFILFMSDDCTHYDIGCYGSKNSITPNIDNFAKEGIQFNYAFQAAPMSSPTRHNLYTGLWPVKSGAFPNHTRANEGTLSVTQHLNSAGYKVALVGKSHVNPSSVFDWDLYAPTLKDEQIDYEAISEFVNSCKNEGVPFCLFVMSRQPHTPWNKGNPDLFNPDSLELHPFYVDIPETRKELCNYYAEINYMDGEFGELLNIIDEEKIRDNSVVVFLSEQGNSLPFAKWTCYSSGVQSACLIRWPGVVEPNSKTDAMIEYVDIVPTFLDIAAAKPLSKLDGESFLGVLTGEKNEHKEYTFSLQTTRGIYHGSDYYGIRSVADKDYRLIVNLTPNAKFKNTETNRKLFKRWLEIAEEDEFAQWVTHKYQHRPALELYDLKNDKFNMNNLAYDEKYEKIVNRLYTVLLKWMKECGDFGHLTEMEAKKFQN